LQQQLDELTYEFLPEADELHRRGKGEELRRLAGSFMQHTYERFDDLADSIGPRRPKPNAMGLELESAMPEEDLQPLGPESCPTR
jgi:hypothetical protein